MCLDVSSVCHRQGKCTEYWVNLTTVLVCRFEITPANVQVFISKGLKMSPGNLNASLSMHFYTGSFICSRNISTFTVAMKSKTAGQAQRSGL